MIESNLEIDLKLDSVTPLFVRTQSTFAKKFSNLSLWCKALESLVYPEHRLIYWIDLFEDAVSEGVNDQEKFLNLLSLARRDVTTVTEGLGSYN